jgi:hypothetical protein
MQEYLFENEIQPEIMCEFSISSDEIDPQIITDKLGITPCTIFKKGDPMKHNKNMKYRFSWWNVQTEYEKTHDINIPLKKIISKISEKSDKIIDLQNTFDIRSQICIVIKIYDDFKPSIYFKKETISFFNSINVDVAFDIYHYNTLEDD